MAQHVHFASYPTKECYYISFWIVYIKEWMWMSTFRSLKSNTAQLLTTLASKSEKKRLIKMWLYYNGRRVTFSSISNSLNFIHILIIKAFDETWLMMMHMYHFNHLFFKKRIQVYRNILSWFRKALWKSNFLNVIYKQPVLINSVKVSDYQRIILIKKSVFDLWNRNYTVCPCSLMEWYSYEEDSPY